MSSTESNNTQNGFEFKKRVPVTIVPEVAASFFVQHISFSYSCGPWRWKLLSTAFSL